VTVLARWETLPVDETQRQALAMPDQNPVAHVARITALSSLAYLQGDLPTLQRALDCLVACDAEVAALAK